VSYNPTAAIEYAKIHWDDGKGLCAEFVSDCLRAGGEPIPTIKLVTKLEEYL
jgi:hypothetical protein